MRQWSCNRLPINNALVSGARARAQGGRKRRGKKKRAEARAREKWRDDRVAGNGRGGRETSATSCECRRARGGVAPLRSAFVLVDDVAGLVHYPCVILIVFTLRLIDVRWAEGDYPSPSSSLRWGTMTREESQTSKVSSRSAWREPSIILARFGFDIKISRVLNRKRERGREKEKKKRGNIIQGKKYQLILEE